MMNGPKDLPPVNSTGFQEAVRERTQTLLGFRGDPLDQALTPRKLGWSAVQTTGGGRSGTVVRDPGGSAGGGGSSTESDLTPPPNVSGLTVGAGISHVFVQIDAPAYVWGGGNRRTNIYGVSKEADDPTLPTFGDAQRIYAMEGPLHIASIPSEPNMRWHLWAKHESFAGVESAEPSGGLNGATATTGQDVGHLLSVLSGEITDSELHAALNSRIDLIDGPDTLAGSVAQRVAAEATARGAAITSEATTRASADSALASSISALASTVSGNSAAITSEASTRASADSALASDIATLSASVSGNSAAISSEASARATVDGYLGAQYTVRAQVSAGGRTVVGGFGLSATSLGGASATIDFGVVADRFWIAAPDGSGVTTDVKPFIVQTTDALVNGVPIPKGVYMDAAYIVNLTAMVARLGEAWIDSAMVSELSAAHLTAGDGTVGGTLKSSNYLSGVSGWLLDPTLGRLYAMDANIVGTVTTNQLTATGGFIGGIRIYSNTVESTDYNGTSAGFRLDGGTGAIYAFKLYASGGTIGGAIIDGTGVESDNYSPDAAGWRLDNSTGKVLAYSGKVGGFFIEPKALRYGATSYSAGTGFWAGDDGGVFKLRLGAPGGTMLDWDGTKLTVNNLEFMAFEASIPEGNITYSGAAGYVTLGSRSVSLSGGRGPFRYSWFYILDGGSGDSQPLRISNPTTTTATFRVVSGGDINCTYIITCVVTDADGRTTMTSMTAAVVLSATGGGE